MRKRILAAFICLCMMVSMIPSMAFAKDENGIVYTDGLCEHHQQHDENCGYTEGTEEVPCSHEHTEDCYTLVTNCIHEHTEECYGEDSTEPDRCNHVCSEETGCITRVLNCQHQHDDACGYVPATEGTPCTYNCPICNNTAEESKGKCICDTLCTEGEKNENCSVCAKDISQCMGQEERSSVFAATNVLGLTRSTPGWDEGTKTYTIIGENGWKDWISLDDGATLYLEDTDYTAYAPNASFGCSGSLTIKYKGKCVIPALEIRANNTTFTFEPVDENSSLEISSVNKTLSKTVEDSKIIINGGKISFAEKLEADSIEIKNGCQLSGSGDRMAGIICNKLTGHIVIEDSKVDLTSSYYTNNGQPGLAPVIGGNGNGYDDSSIAEISGGNDSLYYKLLNNSNEVTSYISIKNSTVNINTDACYRGGIGVVRDITITNSDLNISCGTTVVDSNDARSFYNSGIGIAFQNLRIDGSNVTSYSRYGAGIGVGNAGFNSTVQEKAKALKATITISDSKVTASSEQSAGIGISKINSDRYPQDVEVIIEGDSDVTARSVNGAGIGGGYKTQYISSPDEIIINPGIAGGWDEGGSIDGDNVLNSDQLSMANTFMLMSDTPVEDSTAPQSVLNYVESRGQTLTVAEKDGKIPTIFAESGIFAISSETVATPVTIVQNTVETTPVQTVPIYIGSTKLGDLRAGFRSIAATMPDLTAGAYPMWYGSGDDPDPLLNWNDAAGILYGDSFSVKENSINRYWTLPQQKLGGTAKISTSSGGSPSETAANPNFLYVYLKDVTPASVMTLNKNNTLTYQWYKDGEPISGKTSTYLQSQGPGVYYYTVTGGERYRGTLTSTQFVVTAAGATELDAPELYTVTKDTITLKTPDEGSYTYSIDGGKTWQDNVVFENLTPNTTYSIIRKDTSSGTVSAPLNVTTLGDKPTEQSILEAIDYENECFDSSKLSALNITIYTDEGCKNQLANPANPGSLTAYIVDYGEDEKVLYARLADVSGTSTDEITAVEIPARPQNPTIAKADITFGAAAITVVGKEDVVYNYGKGNSTPANDTAQTCTAQGELITFSGLEGNTEYRIYARVPASNAEKRFHSAQVYYTGTTLQANFLETTILVPSDATSAKTYDLSTVIASLGLGDSFALPNSFVIDNKNIVSNAEGNGKEITVTVTGTAGEAKLTGTNASITVEVVDNVVQEDEDALWIWSIGPNVSGGVEKWIQDIAASGTLVEGEGIDNAQTVAVRTINVRKVIGGTTVSNTGQEITVPYLPNTTAENWYGIFYRDAAGNIQRVTVNKRQNGITFTAVPGTTYFQTTLYSKAISIEVNPKELVLKVGETGTLNVVFTPENTAYKTVTWKTDDANIATVDENGVVTAKGVGTTVITATAADGNLESTCNVTVKKKSSGGGSSYVEYILNFDTNGGDKIESIVKPGNTVIDLNDYIPEKEGYEFKGWYLDEDFRQPVDELTLTESTTVYAKWEKIEEELPEEIPEIEFDDVQKDDWFYDAVVYAVAHGLMNGMGDGTFQPNIPLTREMLAVVLYNVEEQPESAGIITFEDIAAGKWYTDAIAWASQNGIVAGYSETEFGLGDPITREQFAAILYRYANWKGYDTSRKNDLSVYTDAGEISGYAVEAMKWAVQAEVIHGMTETTLVPQGQATRAEAATMLMNFCENVVK